MFALIQYFINRAGKGLSAARKKQLERAKKILQEKKKRGNKYRSMIEHKKEPVPKCMQAEV